MRVKYLFGVITVLTLVAIINSRLELFNIENIFGILFTGLSFFYLPGHILAMVLANKADSPDMWAMIFGYSAQALIIFFAAKKLCIQKQ